MIKFGTSGFRAIIGDEWTKENIQKIGFAFRQIIEASGKQVRIVIGYDNRFMGKEFAQWFCEAACCDSVKATFLAVPVTHPLVAFKTKIFDYGVMITASHNPYIYNGIKFILKGGKDADDDFCEQLTKTIDVLKSYRPSKFGEIVKSCIVTVVKDTDDYVDKILSLIDAKKIKKSGIRVLFDPMHGSSTSIVKRLFDSIGIRYTMINYNADPYFGERMPSPYPYNITDTAKAVVQGKYSFGFCLDGDGDRVAFIDNDGKIYDCNYLAAAFFYYFVEIKKRKGGLIKSVVTSNLAAKLCKKYDRDLFETRVGFKFLGKQLESSNALLAAEPGGIGFKDISLTKDGIASALLLMDLMADTGKSIGALIKHIAKITNFPSECLEYAYPFDASRRDEIIKKLTGSAVPDFEQQIVKRENYPDGYRVLFSGDYWCATRVSGTENVIRLMTEMPDNKTCNNVIKKLEQYYGLTERQGQ